jgi:hypothetical protein
LVTGLFVETLRVKGVQLALGNADTAGTVEFVEAEFRRAPLGGRDFCVCDYAAESATAAFLGYYHMV